MDRKYLIIVVLVIVCAFFVHRSLSASKDFKYQIKEINRVNDSILKVKDKEIKLRDTTITQALKTNDSLLNASDKIKYIKYEKFIYANRTLNDALNVFSKHPVNTRSTN